MKKLLALVTLIFALAVTAGFSNESPAQAATPQVVCGINCDPGGQFYCASWSVGAQMTYNGWRWQCTSGRGAYWAWVYIAGYGYFVGYPNVLDCPCYYWRAVG